MSEKIVNDAPLTHWVSAAARALRILERNPATPWRAFLEGVVRAAHRHLTGEAESVAGTL
jgi:hypothetical protein